jgi:hypothetical protein
MKILFFAPHSAIWQHAFPEALIAEALAQKGNKIVYVGCGGVLDEYCIPMSAYNVPFEAARSEKKRICHNCNKHEKIIRSQFGFSGLNLSDIVSRDDFSFAETSVLSITQDNFLDFVLDGVVAGRIALYELLLDTKKSNFDFTPAEWRRYQASLKNVIIVLRAVQRIFDKTQPDRLVVYNTLYSVNHAVCKIAERREIPYYLLHAGGNLSNRLQTLILARGHSYLFLQYLQKKWLSLRERPCSAKVLKSVTDHFLEVIRGRSPWAYSAAAGGGRGDLKDFFKLDKKRKIICATMSSYDERFAAEAVGGFSFSNREIFPSQVEWIKALINFVKDRDDLNLIIRVHPREFPNKRESRLSQHASMLKNVFDVLPENVRVNWPTDSVSLYDLASITDVFANAWSSTGKEMALLGLPVVLYSDAIPTYPSELNYVGRTLQEYFQQLEQALRDGWSPEWIRKTYRWCAMEYNYSLLDISESFSKSEYSQGSLYSRITRKFVRAIAPYHEQKKDCRKRAARLSVADTINQILENKLNLVLDLNAEQAFTSYSEETEYLKREVGRLVDGLYGNRVVQSEQSILEIKLRGFAGS